MTHDVLVALAYVAMMVLPAIVASIPRDESEYDDDEVPCRPRTARPRPPKSLALSVPQASRPRRRTRPAASYLLPVTKEPQRFD
jgi:hypothetical protein